MDKSVDDTLNELFGRVVSQLEDDKLEEAVDTCDEAFQFGSTIADTTFEQWRTKCVKKLTSYVPYRNSTMWVDMEPGIALNRDSFAYRLLQTVSACLFALGARYEGLEVLIATNCMTQTTPAQWLAACDACVEENYLKLASNCCRFGIRCLMSDTQTTPLLSTSDQELLLTLWFQRSRAFELQNRIAESMAAISIYARLSADFQILNAKKTQATMHPIIDDPLEFAAQRKLAEKRQTRQIAI